MKFSRSILLTLSMGGGGVAVVGFGEVFDCCFWMVEWNGLVWWL